MDAKARDLNQIFDRTISFQIPLFQRPYVWSLEKNWEPLWEDIQSLMEHEIHHRRQRRHFLGAVVLEQLNNVAGSIEAHQVIDGQQRFTTLQLLMLAARDLARVVESSRHHDCFNDLVTNKSSRVDHEHEKFKVWPTNRDRTAFKSLHLAGTLDRQATDELTLERLFPEQADLDHAAGRLAEGYLYFYNQIRKWLSGELDLSDEALELNPVERLESLWRVVSGGLQVVVINLDNDDESQVIFETLNARGTQLLPADLVKNYLFRKAQADDLDIDGLYHRFWSPFDDEFWREEVSQGRAKRPRVDLFLQHYLTLMMREEIRPAHLFESFKEYVQNQQDSGRLPQNKRFEKPNLSAVPVTIEQHLEALARYSRAFRTFSQPPADSRLSAFLERLEAVDTATVYPLLLFACDQLLPAQKAEFDRFITVLESYLIRRMICGLTTKNYNRLFLDVIKALDRQGAITAEGLRAVLQSFEGESSRFPVDHDLEKSILDAPLYRQLAQYKLRAFLSAIDEALADRKSEQIELPKGLTIEHVMPVKWELNWPIPEEHRADPEAKLEFAQNRNRILHTLGNLTLITDSLNPSLSNSGWRKKRPELAKFSRLNLNRYFFPPLDSTEDELTDWDEQAIQRRGKLIADLAKGIWPY